MFRLSVTNGNLLRAPYSCEMTGIIRFDYHIRGRISRISQGRLDFRCSLKSAGLRFSPRRAGLIDSG